jgi:hypothetical protein
MAKDQRKIITATVGEVSPYDLDTTLGNAKAHLEQLIVTYGVDARLDWDSNFYYPYDEKPSPRYHIRVNRPETDDEMAKRLAEEKTWKEAQAARDLAEFQRLNKLFGKK